MTIQAEYSAEFQIELLGLDVESLPEPVLDIACGSTAALVRELRRRGKTAFGLDRDVKTDPFLISADWFDYPMKPGSWGAVISHQGFSNYFLESHLKSGIEAAKCAIKYMEILRSLKTGGVFCYAPGLPFIEEILSAEKYRFVRMPIRDLPDGGPSETELAKAYGMNPFYSCRVEVINPPVK